VDPDDARLLLQFFCERADAPSENPPELLSHLRDAFRSYLNRECNLEVALGVPRLPEKDGRPRNDKGRQRRLAAEVLKHMLAGLSLEQAAATVSGESSTLLESWGYGGEKRDLGETQIREAWAKNKPKALLVLCIERAQRSIRWTPDEELRLNKMFEQVIGRAGKLAE